MELRKVMFKKWIPREYRESEAGFERQVENTGCFQKDFENEGLFHQWATSYEKFENRAGNFTVALVETLDGTIETVLPHNLKFVTHSGEQTS